MRSSVTSNLVITALLGGLASLYGCSGGDDTPGGGNNNPFGGTGNTAGTGNQAAGTGNSTAGSGTAGSSNPTAGSGMGGSGTAGSGTAGTGTAAGAGGMSGGAGGTANGGSGGGTPGGDITKVWKSDGCGKAFAGQSGQTANIGTMGVKDAQCADALGGQPKCGAWGSDASTWQKTPVPREYTINLPTPYDQTKAYPLVFQGPGCGGGSKDVYPLNGNIGNTVIRVGLKPPPTYIGHGTNPGEGCFDDKEGDDSVDWVFYENLYDKLNAEVCFDRNRVFSAGNSSGSWFSNELICKYAGDAKRPVRGAMPNTGGLPTDPKHVPTCTKAPMAGMWIHEVGDTTNNFAGNKVAIARAMTVNNCQGAKDWDAAVAANQVENFPIGGGVPDDTCKKIKGCPDLYPLVVCPLPGNGHGSHDTQANNGFSTFVKLFSAGTLISQ